MNNIKAIIFDLNGIFIQGPKLSDLFREKFGIASEDFLPVLKEVMAKIRMPNAGNSFSYWEPYLKKWNINLSEKELLKIWFSSEKEVPDMVKLAKDLKNKGLKIFILSNNFLERVEYYKNFPFLEEIADKIYYSWQTGFVKPDIRAYQKILSDYNLKPEECLYFDDSKNNVEVATQLGIKSFLFEGIDSIKRILQVSSFKFQDS